MLRAKKAGESGRTACHHHSHILLSPSHLFFVRSFLRVQSSHLLFRLATFTRASRLPTRRFLSTSVSFSLLSSPRAQENRRESRRARKMPVIRRDLEYAPRRRDEAGAARIRTRGRASSRRTPRDLEACLICA